MQFFLPKKSFTLIEMLIVIVIVGILAAALVPRLQSVQARARDTKRKTDLKTIYNANEIYLLDNGVYARPGTGSLNSTFTVRSIHSQPRIPQLSGILSTIPIDPLNLGPTLTTGYHYSYFNVYSYNGTQGVNTYDLLAKLENSLDPDRHEVRIYYHNYPPVLWDSADYRKNYYNYSPHSNSF